MIVGIVKSRTFPIYQWERCIANVPKTMLIMSQDKSIIEDVKP